MAWRARLLGAVLVACLIATGAFAEIDNSDLERLRQAIVESRERVGAHEQKERDLLARLEEIEQRLETIEAERTESGRIAGEAKAALRELEPALQRASRQLEKTRRAMARRAVALYKSGELGPVRVLFSAASLPELLARASTLRRLLEHDAELVERHRDEKARVEAVTRQKRSAAEIQGLAAEQLAALEKELVSEKRERRTFLAAVRTDRSRERALLVELEHAARALEETLGRLDSASAAPEDDSGLDGPGFATLRGRLPLPVDAAIARSFGRVVDQEYQTETFRKGVEFAAPAGERVEAVAAGHVRFAGWFRGYGKIVILDHGDGYFSVSAHLDEIFVEVGSRVSPADTIGTVGETGSLTGPGLYFEVREGSTPLDPAEWFAGS